MSKESCITSLPVLKLLNVLSAYSRVKFKYAATTDNVNSKCLNKQLLDVLYIAYIFMNASLVQLKSALFVKRDKTPILRFLLFTLVTYTLCGVKEVFKTNLINHKQIQTEYIFISIIGSWEIFDCTIFVKVLFKKSS